MIVFFFFFFFLTSKKNREKNSRQPIRLDQLRVMNLVYFLESWVFLLSFFL